MGLKDLTIENSILFVLKTMPLNFDGILLCEMQFEVVQKNYQKKLGFEM